MKMVSIETECAVLIDDIIWFFASEFNGLFSYNMKMGNIINHGGVPWEDFDGKNLFASMQYIKDDIYLLPLTGKKIAIYHIEEEEYSELELDYEKLFDDRGVMLASTILDDCIFAFSIFKPIITCIDTKNKEITYLEEWYDKLKEEIFDDKEIFFRKQICLLDKKIWIPFCNANAILELDGTTKKVDIHILGQKKQGYSGICYKDRTFYCPPRARGGSLISWDPNSCECLELAIENGKTDKMYAALLVDNEQLRLYPATALECNLDGKGEIIVKGTFSYLHEDDQKVLMQEKGKKDFLIWDKQSNRLVKQKIEVPIESTSLYREFKEKTVQETSWKGIDELNNYIFEMEESPNRNEEKNVGKEVYIKVRGIKK